LLLQKGLVLDERDFFKDRFSEAEIRGLAAMVGLSDIFAWRSPSFKQLGRAGQDISPDELVKLMLEEPRLVRRPLIKLGDRLLVGGNIKVIEAALARE
jgi:regulatory protein spx